MKKTYIKILILIITFVLKINVQALSYGGCEYSTIANLKSLVNNVNISYTYDIVDNDAVFKVTLNNIPKDVYFIDSNTKNRYEYNDTQDGEILIDGYKNVTKGQYKFYVNNNVCNDIKVGVKFYNFPIYNKRHSAEICQGLEEYYLCKKWVTKYYNDSEFEQKIEEYKKNQEEEDNILKETYEKDYISKFVEFYIKYYYYFLPVIIIVCIIVITISKKKNSFKL